MRERVKLFFAKLFLLISSVFTEQSQICVTNANPAMLEQRDVFWWDNMTHCLCQQVCWWKHQNLWLIILRKPVNLLQDCVWNDSLPSHHEDHIAVIKFCTDAGFTVHYNLVTGNLLPMPQDNEEFPQFTEAVTRREYRMSRNWERFRRGTWRKVGFEEAPEIEARSLEVTGPARCKSSYGVAITEWTSVIWRQCSNRGDQAPQVLKARTSYSEVILRKMIQGSHAVFNWTGIIRACSSTIDRSKTSWTMHIQSRSRVKAKGQSTYWCQPIHKN